MNKLKDFMNILTGSFNNSEQFDKMKLDNIDFPYAEHVNTICNDKIINLPEDFKGIFMVEESYYTSNGNTHASPHLFLFTQEENGIKLTSYEVPNGYDKNTFTYKDLKEIDYNYPFKKTDTHHQIMTLMLSLYEQTLKNTFNLIDLDELLHIVQALKKANNIYIFPSIGNYFMAESFQQSMLEIGVKVDVIKEAYYQHWNVQLCKEGDIVMLISYAGRTPQIKNIVQELNQKNIPIILISSTIHTPIDQFAKYHLYFSSYEDSEEKIASFSSRISLQYLLDCIYACYFNRDYQKNLEYKIKNYID